MSGRAAATNTRPGDYALSVGMPDRAAPPGWKWVALSDVAEMASGHTPSRNHPEYWSNAQISWVTATDANPADGGVINDTREKINQLGLENSAAVLLPAGTVCLSRTGASIGYTVILGHPMATNQGFVNWICSDVLNKWFLLHLFMAERRALFSFGEGSAHKTIYFPEAKAFHICLPPRREQDQIVTKLAEVFSDLDAGVAALKRVKASLKRYRASVLKAAVEGRLTEAWRKKNLSVEPAAKLLERILAERRAKWEAEQLRKFTEAGKMPPKGWREAYEAPKQPTPTELSALPITWTWALTEQLGRVQLGRQRSPKNRSRDHATKYIRAANITEKGLDLSDVMDMEFQPHELDIYRMEPGDLVLSEASGSPNQVGKPAIWRGELVDCCFQNTVLRLRPLIVVSEYLLTVFTAFYVTKVFAKIAGGVGINHLSAAKFARIAIPLPPLAEQAEIVAEVDRRLSIADAAEAQVEHGLQRAARLRQAILKRAFEGKLVPQDPTDEPAAVLLEPIRAGGGASGHRAVIRHKDNGAVSPTKGRSRAHA